MMEEPRKPSQASAFLDYEETRLANLESFARSTPDQRVDWLADMLAVFQAGSEQATLRASRKGSDQTSAPRWE